MIENLKKKYEVVYREFFFERDGDRLKVPKVSTSYVEKNLLRFYEGLTGLSSSVIFLKDKTWDLNYYFLGELNSDFRDLGVHDDGWIKFRKSQNEIDVNHEALFCLMIVLKRETVKKLGTLKGTGLPDWFKYERYDKFSNDLRFILRKSSNRKEILRGRPLNVAFFKTQKEIVDFLKGRVKDEKILAVIDVCKKRSPGWKRVKGFRDFKEFSDSFVLFKEEILKELSALELKEKKITDGVMKKFLLYLGLMATVQTREARPIEINTHTEQIIFNFYTPLRRAAERLGLMKVVDSTFCPGVRSRSFLVSVMCKVPEIGARSVYLNKIESAYKKLSFEDRLVYAAKIGYQAIPYLKDRVELYDTQENLEYLKSVNKKNRFVARQYGKDHGSEWVKKKWNEVRLNETRQRYFDNFQWMSFQAKYSHPRNYMWADRPGRMVA